MSRGAAHTGHVLDGATGGVILGRAGQMLECDTAATADDDRGRNDVGYDCRVRAPPGVVPSSRDRFVGYIYRKDCKAVDMFPQCTLLHAHECHSKSTRTFMARLRDLL